MRSLLFIPVVFSILFSCRSHQKSNDPVETIKVDGPDEFTKANFSDFFSSWKLIPLETNKESLIGSIDRITLYDHRLYILDRQTNSVLVFNDTGKFERRIHNIGQGPGEYIGIMDFAIDKERRQIIVHSHRPYRMLYYDLNGKFLHEEKMSTFYSGIACVQSDLIEVNRRKDLNNMAFVKDLGRGGVRKYVPFSKKEELFESFGTVFPYIVQSEHTYITLPSESTIYQFNGEGVYPKYFIDFGRHTIPESQFGNGNTAKKIYRDAQRNWDGISISNFRECKDHICFTYGNSVVVIYSKKDKTARTFTVALNTLGFLPFQNYFGHDGDDNNLISIYESSTFREQMKAFKGDSVIWGKEAEEIKHIEGLVKDNDNPLLLVCNLKPSL